MEHKPDATQTDATRPLRWAGHRTVRQCAVGRRRLGRAEIKWQGGGGKGPILGRRPHASSMCFTVLSNFTDKTQTQDRDLRASTPKCRPSEHQALVTATGLFNKPYPLHILVGRSHHKDQERLIFSLKS